MNFQLAQINVARIKGTNIEDPIMKEFVDNLETINALAESSPGFVWRLKDDTDNATSFNPYEDETIIVNVSVWENIDSLKAFAYQSFHREFLKRKKEWFTVFGKAHMAMWWIDEGSYPTITQAVKRLDHLQKNGAEPYAFDFKNTYTPNAIG